MTAPLTSPGLKHLNRVYQVASLFARNEPEARRLVERAYERVAEAAEPADLVHLLRELTLEADSDRLDLHDKDRRTDRESVESARPAFRDEAMGLVSKALAPAFASLSSREQMSLVLVETHRIGADQLAVVFGTELEEALAIHQRALSRLVTRVLDQLDPIQVAFALDHLPETWIGHVLESTTMRGNKSAPDALRVRITSRMGPSVGSSLRTGRESGEPGAPSSRSRGFARFRGAVFGVALVIALGMLSYYVAGLAVRPPETNVIQLTAMSERTFSPSLATTSRDEAAAFFQASGRSLTPPEIAGARLAGAGLAEISAGVRVAALQYADRASGSPVTVYAMTYSDLDRYAGSIELPKDVLLQIQNDLNFDLHPLEEREVLVWRRGAWIYLAVSTIVGEELRERIYEPADQP